MSETETSESENDTELERVPTASSADMQFNSEDKDHPTASTADLHCTSDNEDNSDDSPETTSHESAT